MKKINIPIWKIAIRNVLNIYALKYQKRNELIEQIRFS